MRPATDTDHHQTNFLAITDASQDRNKKLPINF